MMQKRLLYKISCLSIFLGLAACQSSNAPLGTNTQIPEPTVQNTEITNPSVPLPPNPKGYNLKQPDKTWELEPALKEVSGIALSADNQLYAVQDEQGFLYQISTETGKITKTTRFAQRGDFEGIRFVKDELWVLEASGKLFQIKNWKTDNPSTQKHITTASEQNDAEGLEYDAANGRLLIAFKNSALLSQMLKTERAVYGFDLKTNQLGNTPLFKLTIPQVREHLKKYPQQYTQEDGLEKLGKGKMLPMMPSEIAIHPITKEIYILTATGCALFVLDKTGKQLLKMYDLENAVYEQTEGLAFAANGDMYISSEGKFTVPKLFRFKYK